MTKRLTLICSVICILLITSHSFARGPITQLQARANAGECAAQVAIGKRIQHRASNVENVKTAERWFREAADKGFVPAFVSLGNLYDPEIKYGWGKEDWMQWNDNNAESWFMMALESGSAEGYEVLASLRMRGWGSKHDCNGQLGPMMKAAKLGIPSAQYEMASA
jgi:TPR repeat protein